MKIDHFDLELEKDGYGVYYLAGEELKGIIEVHVMEKVRIARLSVRIFGSAQTGWRNKLSEEVYESKELILDEYKDLTSDLSMHCSEALEILEGQHKIHFKIKLPLDVVSSIEKEGHGHVKYTCMAVLDVPEGGDSEIVAAVMPKHKWKFIKGEVVVLLSKNESQPQVTAQAVPGHDATYQWLAKKLECDFGVVSLLNLDAPHFKQPVHSYEQVNIIGFCCRRPKGWISAEVEVNELGILPGETVRISLTIENTVKKKMQRNIWGHINAHSCPFASN